MAKTKKRTTKKKIAKRKPKSRAPKTTTTVTTMTTKTTKTVRSRNPKKAVDPLRKFVEDYRDREDYVDTGERLPWPVGTPIKHVDRTGYHSNYMVLAHPTVIEEGGRRTIGVHTGHSYWTMDEDGFVTSTSGEYFGPPDPDLLDFVIQNEHLGDAIRKVKQLKLPEATGPVTTPAPRSSGLGTYQWAAESDEPEERYVEGYDENPTREHNMERLYKTDKAVIRAFTEQRAAEGNKLRTNGRVLDGLWMGGNGIAFWQDGKIRFHDLGSKSAVVVQNAVRREAPKNDLYGGRGWNPSRVRNPDLTDHEDELVLYIDNTASLYEDYKRIATRLIDMKQGRGRVYGRTAAIARFSRLVQRGAEMYRSEIDNSEKWKVKEISRIAQDYAERFEKDYDSGELAWLGGPARSNNPKTKTFEVGDLVRYTTNFLRSTGQHASKRLDGVVVGHTIRDNGTPMDDFPIVSWNDYQVPSSVNAANIEKKKTSATRELLLGNVTAAIGIPVGQPRGAYTTWTRGTRGEGRHRTDWFTVRSGMITVPADAVKHAVRLHDDEHVDVLLTDPDGNVVLSMQTYKNPALLYSETTLVVVDEDDEESSMQRNPDDDPPILVGQDTAYRAMEWHGGQGTALYSMASSAISGRPVPRSTIEAAAADLRIAAKKTRKRADKREALYLARLLDAYAEGQLASERQGGILDDEFSEWKNPYQGDAFELAKYRKARDAWEKGGRRGPPPHPPRSRNPSPSRVASLSRRIAGA